MNTDAILTPTLSLAEGEGAVSMLLKIVKLRYVDTPIFVDVGQMGYLRWYAGNLWTFVPAQGYIKKFLATIPDYPFQRESGLNGQCSTAKLRSPRG